MRHNNPHLNPPSTSVPTVEQQPELTVEESDGATRNSVSPLLQLSPTTSPPPLLDEASRRLVTGNLNGQRRRFTVKLLMRQRTSTAV
jgi:hypothetical protein